MMARVRQRLPALLRAAVALPRTITAPRRSPPRLRFVYLDTGASTRYRVWHHLEQAQIAGFVADAVPLHDSRRLYDLSQTDLIYIHRLPLAALTLPLVVRHDYAAFRWCSTPMTWCGTSANGNTISWIVVLMKRLWSNGCARSAQLAG